MNGQNGENTEAAAVTEDVAPVEKTQAERESERDAARWKLSGLRLERTELESRLKYLHEQEQALTGIAETRTATIGGVGVRKRVITEEQRKAMSDAARRRWGKQPVAPGTAPAAATPRVRRNRNRTAPASTPTS